MAPGNNIMTYMLVTACLSQAYGEFPQGNLTLLG